MSDKPKKRHLKEQRAELRAKNEQLRLETLAKEGRVVDGHEIPRDAVAADLSQQAPNNSYSPPYYYQDIEFVCVDCGESQVWLAKDRKWYYEVAKGSIYAGPKRCRSCRKRLREIKARHRAQQKAANRAQKKGDDPK